MRKINDVVFRLPGQPSNLEGKQWAGISLQFSADDDHHRDIDISLLVPVDPSATLLELHRVSRDDAIETLKAALSALEQHDISKLAEQAATNVREADRVRDEQLKADIASAIKSS